MDREQTPLKQRQKRGAARTAGASERAFRSSGVSQRGRAKVSAGAQAATGTTAKPPLTILRAPPTAGSSHPPSPSATQAPAKTLYSPPPAPSRASYAQQPRNGSVLRVNTAPSGATAPLYASPSPSPLAVAGTPRKPSTPGASGSVAPSAVLQRPSGSALPPLVSAPPSATKLITSSFQFASDIPTRLAPCLELTNFTVVGTLGLEGAGKSTLLSLLAQLAFATGKTAEQAFDGMSTLRDRTKNPYFLAQRLETQLAGLQETQGVDLAVACEAPRLRANTGGLVLLDTQPLLSASHLGEVLVRAHDSSSAAAAAARYGALTPEQQHELASIQIAVLLLSVCHYVIVPVRGAVAADLELAEFLRKVHDKMQQCRLPNVSGHVVKDKHHAQLLFVANEAPAGSASSESDRKALHALTHVLPSEWVYRPRNQSQVDAPWKFESLTSDATPNAVHDWRVNALQWARFVESLPASPSFTKQSPGSAPTAPPPLTLKEWLSNTARVWESVKRSSALTEEYMTRDNY